jgi:hypothetical protein
MLRTMFGLILGPDGWIIGSDFFRDRVMVIDYPARCFVDLTAV